MQYYSSRDNYVSLKVLDYIAANHPDLVISISGICFCGKPYRISLWTKDRKYYLGCTRELRVLPKRYKHLMKIFERFK